MNPCGDSHRAVSLALAAALVALAALSPLTGCASAPRSAKTPSVAGAAGGASAQWIRHRLGYGALTYQMPAEPQVARIAHPAVDIDQAQLTVGNGGVVFEVESFHHEAPTLADASRLLSGAVTAFLQRIGGVVASRRAINVDGYPGEDLQCDFPSTGTSARVRVIVGRFEAYTVMASVPTSWREQLNADIERFMTSIQLDAGDAPDADGDGALSATTRYVEPVGAFFALRMPGAPRREQGTYNAESSQRPMVTYTVEAQGGAERWQVRVTSFEGRPAGSNYGRVVSELTGAGWVVRDDRAVSVQGYSGRAYVLASSDGRSLLTMRLFATESRIYDVRAVLPADSVESRREQLTSYFDSLRIL